ncbi:GRAS family transcription factor family protein [Euphorbia peplus]|nr:GRAS family transcription factor family protein [Euphorbia peplus]
MEKFDFHEVQYQLNSAILTSESMEKGNGEHCYAAENSRKSQGVDSHFSDRGFNQNTSLLDDLIFFNHQPQPFLDYDFGSESNYHIAPRPVLQTCSEQTAELGRLLTGKQDAHQDQPRFASVSLELLKTHVKGMKRLSSEGVIKSTIDPSTIDASNMGYSTEKIMRVARERFMQSFTKTADVFSMLDNPFGFPYSDLPDEETKKVELAELLMASAEKVGKQLYDSATMLLNQCDELSSSTGNAVERVVYYFSKALRERMDRETGKETSQGLRKELLSKIDEAMMTPSPNLLAIYQEVPFLQIAHCATVEAIIENVNGEENIHVVDLGILIGVQWTGLMQALVSESVCPLKLLKITAVGTMKKQSIEDTGKRLTSFAESISLPFSFKIVMVSDMLELHEDLFELEANEAVVVYSSYLLKRLIHIPGRLDYMMKLIRILNPSIMVLKEPELDSISPSFMNRFVETVPYFSAYFDCLEICLRRDDPSRKDIESLYFGEAIRNILCANGEERHIQHVKLDVWREFFARYGMVETQMSESSLLHAKLMAGKFACGNACSLELDGKNLFIGWEGTPLISLSAWKFNI